MSHDNYPAIYSALDALCLLLERRWEGEKITRDALRAAVFNGRFALAKWGKPAPKVEGNWEARYRRLCTTFHAALEAAGRVGYEEGQNAPPAPKVEASDEERWEEVRDFAERFLAGKLAAYEIPMDGGGPEQFWGLADVSDCIVAALARFAPPVPYDEAQVEALLELMPEVRVAVERDGWHRSLLQMLDARIAALRASRPVERREKE